MNAAKIVIGEVQCTSSLEVVQFLAVPKCQPCKSLDGLSHGQVLPLNETGRNVVRVGPSIAYLHYGFYHRRRRISCFRITLAVVSVQLYHLRKVCLPTKDALNRTIEVIAVSRDLEPFFVQTLLKASQELNRGFFCALPDLEVRHELGIRVQRYEYPLIAEFCRIVFAYITLLLGAKSPDFVALQALAVEVTHSRIHQCYAALSGENQQAKDCVAVQLRDALRTTHAGTFDQKLNCQQRFVLWNDHVAKQSGVFFGIRLSALRAAKPLEAVAVRSVFPAFQVAQWAIHSLNSSNRLLFVKRKDYVSYAQKLQSSV